MGHRRRSINVFKINVESILESFGSDRSECLMKTVQIQCLNWKWICQTPDVLPHNFLSVAKCEAAIGTTAGSPLLTTWPFPPPFSCFQRSKHCPHSQPLFAISTRDSPGLAYLFTLNSNKGWSQSKKAYKVQKQMIKFQRKWGQEQYDNVRRMSRGPNCVLWCTTYLRKVGHRCHAGFLAANLERKLE